MPQKKIVIPPPISFRNPANGEPVEGPDGVLTFADFIGKLNSNPLWAETFQAAMAQRSINAALEASAKTTDSAHLLISEEDWKFLETAAKNPRTMIFGPGGSGVVPGLGFHPSLAGQIVPFQLSIINAETV
jgi:hypothetical protein